MINEEKGKMKMIVSNNQHSIQAVTHAGIFHADEVMATAILGRCGITQVSRVLAVPEGLDESVIVFDIGGGKYDHHQKAGKPLRTNGTPYAACGLIWRDFGRRACAGILGQVSPSLLETVWEAVDRTMIRPIDLIDNGEIEKGKSSLSALISDFNPCWNSVEDADASFLRAVELADTVLCNRVRVCAATAEAEELVKDALRGADGPVLVLDRFAPWKTALEPPARGYFSSSILRSEADSTVSACRGMAILSPRNARCRFYGADSGRRSCAASRGFKPRFSAIPGGSFAEQKQKKMRSSWQLSLWRWSKHAISRAVYHSIQAKLYLPNKSPD